MGALLAATGLKKTYRMGRVDTPVLRGLDVMVAEGEFVAILGASGSGKSTLLHLLGGLDRPDRDGGERWSFGRGSLSDLSSGEMDVYRRREVGFVFQFYHLLPELSALENVLVAGMAAHGFGYRGKRGEMRERASGLLERMGLADRLSHRPSELSGGERQRVAIARSLLNEPAVLLADEPTGNLDRAAGEGDLRDSLSRLHEDEARSAVMVTHDEELAARADRVLRMADGRLVTGVGV